MIFAKLRVQRLLLESLQCSFRFQIEVRRVQMKAKHGVSEETIQGRPRAMPIIRQLHMRAISGDGIFLPFLDVYIGDVLQFMVSRAQVIADGWTNLVVFHIRVTAQDTGDLAHGFYSNNSLECQVRLQREPPCKIIRAHYGMSAVPSRHLRRRSRWFGGSNDSSTRYSVHCFQIL